MLLDYLYIILYVSLGFILIEKFEVKKRPRFQISKRLWDAPGVSTYRAQDLSKGEVFLSIFSTQEGSRLQPSLQNEIEPFFKLRHTNILPPQEFLEIEDSPALVSDFFSGKPITEVQFFPSALPEMSVFVALEILNALEHAHENNIVHGFLIPSQILVSEKGEVKVAGFGMAPILDHVSELSFDSPWFFSPEQVNGEEPDIRSDLFSVAAILYFLTTETHPFSENSHSAAPSDGKFESPQERNPRISAGLQSILIKGLSKTPENRFQSAKEFRESLQNYLSQIGIGPEDLNLKHWFASPEEQTFKGLQLLSNRLGKKAEIALSRGKLEHAVQAMTHLSSVAPSSPKNQILVDLYEKKLNQFHLRKKLLMSAFLLLFVAGSGLFLRKGFLEKNSSQITQTQENHSAGNP